MEEEIRIIHVTAGNVTDAGVCCVKDKKSPGFKAKLEWFQQKHRPLLPVSGRFLSSKMANCSEITI
jgi:hypothetical protein